MTQNFENKLSSAELEHALVTEAMRRYDRFLMHGLGPEHFESPRAVAVVRALADAYEAGEATDFGGLSLRLQRTGALATHWQGSVKELAEYAVSTGHTVPDPVRLKELCRLRQIRNAAMAVAQIAAEGDYARAVQALNDAQDGAVESTEHKTKNAYELCVATVQDIRAERKDKKRKSERRVTLGLPRFRRALGALPVGSMTVIAADSGVGKSSVALELLMAQTVSSSDGRHQATACGLVSVEDPEEVTGGRLLAMYSRVSSRQIQHRQLEDSDVADLEHAAEDMRKMGDWVLFDDCTGGNELDVCAAMSRQRKRGAKLIVVDYIGEIESSKRQQDRRNEIRWIAKRLKKHAKRIGVALVIISQLKRPEKGDPGKRPTKHDIKESGDVVNMSEVIVMLWRKQESDFAPVRVAVTKVKWGGLGHEDSEWTMTRTEGSGGRLLEDA